MFLCTAEGKKVKIAFELPQENIKIGDFVKVYNDKGGIVAQIINVKTDEKSSGNYAEGIILKTLLKDNQWSEWQGNLPARGFTCQKVSSVELTENTAGKDVSDPVNLGYLISNNKPFDVSADKISNPFVILGDANSIKTKTIKKLALELSGQNKKCVIFDLKGDFSSLNPKSALIAGKNFKLSLNSAGIQSLYEKTLNEIPAKTKAVIEDVLMHVQDYADSSDLGFIPFASFKGVVENEYKNGNVGELVLLKNQLAKLEKQGVYGNTRREINAFKNVIDKENIVTIDLSALPELWHTEILNCVINTGIKENLEFVLFVEAEGEFSDSKLIDKILSLKNKSKITPFLSASYQNKNIHKLISYAENILFFAPKFSFDFVSFKEYLELLSLNNTVFYGSASSEIPVFLNIETDIEYCEEAELFEPQQPVYPQPDFSRFLSVPDSYVPFESPQEKPAVEIKEIPVMMNEIFADAGKPEEEPAMNAGFQVGEFLNFDVKNFDDKASAVFEPVESFEAVEEEKIEPEDEFEEFEEYNLGSEDEPEYTYEQAEEIIEEPLFEAVEEDYEQVEETYEEEVIEEPRFESVESEEDYEPVEEIIEESEEYEEINPYELDDSFEDVELSEEVIIEEEPSFSEPLIDYDDQITSDVDTLYTGGRKTTTLENEPIQEEIPVYAVESEPSDNEIDFNEGEKVEHDKYGTGTIKKIINYGNKKLLSIQFEGVGRRLLDPQLAVIRKA